MPDQTLTWQELARAAEAGCQRRIRALHRGRQPAHGRQRGGEWDGDIEGVAAEMLVAKTLGVYWMPVVGQLDKDRGDVGGFHVRSTTRPDGCLIVHENDTDGIYILVAGPAPYARVVGWKSRDGALDQKFWREDTGRPAFFVPQRDLHPVGDLVKRDAA